MDNFFPLPNLFKDLTNRKSTAARGTYQKINAAKPTNKQLKQDEIHATRRDDLNR
jgi:hypothetical protein